MTTQFKKQYESTPLQGSNATYVEALADRGVELVVCADCLDLRVILWHALAVYETGRAVVPGACGD
jgi:hypothetical protein